MSMVAAAVSAVGALAVAGATIYSANVQADAAKKASETQGAAAQAGIDTQNQRFQQIQELLTPYTQAGSNALSAQQDLSGVNGPEAQQRAISQIEGGAEFGAMTKQGENAILQNASATGGLRGGNVQGALSTFRPQVLSSLINQQYSRLGGIASLGANATGNLAAFGQGNANAVSGLLQQQGAAQAGGQLAGAQGGVALANGISSGLGLGAGLFNAIRPSIQPPVAPKSEKVF